MLGTTMVIYYRNVYKNLNIARANTGSLLENMGCANRKVNCKMGSKVQKDWPQKQTPLLLPHSHWLSVWGCECTGNLFPANSSVRSVAILSIWLFLLPSSKWKLFLSVLGIISAINGHVICFVSGFDRASFHQNKGLLKGKQDS